MPPTPDNLHEIRCRKCDRFLCKASIFVGEIKCKGCGETIHIELYSHKALTEAFYGGKIAAVREGQKAPEAKARETSATG